jgi:hypothetical protein
VNLHDGLQVQQVQFQVDKSAAFLNHDLSDLLTIPTTFDEFACQGIVSQTNPKLTATDIERA